MHFFCFLTAIAVLQFVTVNFRFRASCTTLTRWASSLASLRTFSTTSLQWTKTWNSTSRWCFCPFLCLYACVSTELTLKLYCGDSRFHILKSIWIKSVTSWMVSGHRQHLNLLLQHVACKYSTWLMHVVLNLFVLLSDKD